MNNTTTAAAVNIAGAGDGRGPVHTYISKLLKEQLVKNAIDGKQFHSIREKALGKVCE